MPELIKKIFLTPLLWNKSQHGWICWRRSYTAAALYWRMGGSEKGGDWQLVSRRKEGTHQNHKSVVTIAWFWFKCRVVFQKVLHHLRRPLTWLTSWACSAAMKQWRRYPLPISSKYVCTCAYTIKFYNFSLSLSLSLHNIALTLLGSFSCRPC